MLGGVHMDRIGLWRHPLHFINHMSYQRLVNCFVNKALAGRRKKGVGVENVNSWCDVKTLFSAESLMVPPSPSASSCLQSTPLRPILTRHGLVTPAAWTILHWLSCPLSGPEARVSHPYTAKEKEPDGLSGPKSRGLEMKWSKQCRYWDQKTQRAELTS